MSEVEFTATPLSGLRKVVAARMVEASQSIPHFRLAADLEVDALLSWRKRLNSEAGAERRISVNDCLIKACAHALMDVPALNVQLVEDSLRQYAHADISVVVSVRNGLVTPVIRNADLKTIREIASEARQLAGRAARNALKMEEIVGGTFSISNLGMNDVDRFDAIINPPQCAILAVGAAKPRMLVSSELEPYAANTLTVTLSCDHRVIDGATGAKFLGALRARLDQPQGYLAAGGS